VNTPGSTQSASKIPGTKTAHKHHTTKPAVEPERVVATRPPDPPPPDWPANDKAQPASVGWNGRELRVAAANSSLKQVLSDISTATGVKVDGGASDQRIYGTYGPGPARDVLSQLLEGSGYNVLMVGDQGEGTPREVVLTSKTGRGGATQTQPGMNQQNQGGDEDAPEEPEVQEQPEPIVPQRLQPQAPGDGRTPQQIQQEMQQRQQQLQQLQQQQPGQQPPKE